ncbi:MAG: acetyl-CoA hydrolase/transferase C-terminal domain-containing protein [Pseudomonadota bacterium]
MGKSLARDYEAKQISAEQAAGMVQSGQTIHLGGSANVAAIIGKYLARRAGELRGVTVKTYLDTLNYDFCQADPEGKAFNWCSGFLLSHVRPLSQERGVGVYIPESWHAAPMIYRQSLHFDYFFIVTAPMDDKGYFNFGLTSGHNRAIADVADKVVVIERKDMPVIYGGNEEGLHLDKVDWVVRDDEFKTFCLPAIKSRDEDRLIAGNILESGLIKDGSTLQIGIGGLPNAVLDSVAESGIKDCGLHTEMLTSKMVDLIENGVVTNSRKNLDRHKTVFTFCLGDRTLYDYADRNPGFALYPVDYTNSPMIIAQQPDMFSLNSTISVDLTGQAASEQVVTNGRPRQISGTGGQMDFVMGTLLARDQKGISVLSLYSSYKGISRIVPLLDQGTNVTVPRSLTQYVATEWGVVNVRGLSNSERARALIAIAHPDFREDLTRQARELGLMSYSPIKKNISGLVFARQ